MPSDQLLASLGLPQGDESTRRKILSDNLFFNRCLERLVATVAPAVADSLNQLERTALIRRVSRPPPPSKPRPLFGQFPAARKSPESMPSGSATLRRVCTRIFLPAH